MNSVLISFISKVMKLVNSYLVLGQVYSRNYIKDVGHVNSMKINI